MNSCCVICAEETTENMHTLPCGHSFHANCIIDWFRGAHTCPLCRTSSKFTRIETFTRASMLRRMSRRKNMPSELKKLVENLRIAEANTREQKKVLREFKTENKLILRRRILLEQTICKLARKERALKRQLGLFSDSSLTIPLLYKKRQETES